MRKIITIAGVDFEVLTSEETEEADICVCMPLGPSQFDDNLTGECADCGCQIMYRPYIPAKPAKVCPLCAVTRIKGPASTEPSNPQG
jgi:hypothetical protein